MPPSRDTIRRDILKVLRNHGHRSFRAKELANKLGYRDKRAYRLFREVLAEMTQERSIARLKGGRYTFKARPTVVEGTLSVNPQMYGFVSVPGEKEDLFVKASNMGTAIDGDRVRVGLLARKANDRGPEAEILEVLERNRTTAVGTLQKQGTFAFVLPDDQRLVHDVYVAREDFNGAKEGDKVVVSIDRFDDPKASPEGRVLEVIGPGDDPEVRVLALALSLDVRTGFPEAVEKEARAIPTEIPKTEIARRLDLRAKRAFTIDPVDAKDFDDALHVVKLDNGNLEVGVHIADVSHYVGRGSAIDAEADKRGTSVYLVDRVIPMLPEKLSNEVCSLRPDEDKLCFSCIMEVSPGGEVKRFEIRETVIHSVQRFTYEEAEEVLKGNGADHPLASDLADIGGLARTLSKQRFGQGSVDFELPEIRIVLDGEGHPVDIVRKERLDAHRLIEELMLLANQTVARHIERQFREHAFVYRVHEAPDAEKIRHLANYVRIYGYQLPHDGGRVASRDLNDLLQHVKGSSEEFIIEDAALRAMAKAKYDTDNVGHYGLGFKSYTHFTSPIRRYPDLMVHRLVKRYQGGGAGVDLDELTAACEHASGRERAAVEAERESVKLKQVEYISEHLGERFEGVVTGVTRFGIHVLLTEPLVEGLVHVRDLDDDYYVYDEETYSLVGDYTGKRYRPGDRIATIVAAADVESRRVDLVLGA